MLTVLALGLAGAAAAQREAASKLKIGQPATFRGTQTVPRARLRITLWPTSIRCIRGWTASQGDAVRRLQAPDREPHQAALAGNDRLVGDARRPAWAPLRRHDLRDLQPWAVKLPSLDEGTTIEGKRTVVGYLGWILPKKLELREFRYQLELGPDVAAWVLPRR